MQSQAQAVRSGRWSQPSPGLRAPRPAAALPPAPGEIPSPPLSNNFLGLNQGSRSGDVPECMDTHPLCSTVTAHPAWCSLPGPRSCTQGNACLLSLFLVFVSLLIGKVRKACNFRPLPHQNGWLNRRNTHSSSEAQILSPSIDHNR